jgi:hypothetical protein
MLSLDAMVAGFYPKVVGGGVGFAGFLWGPCPGGGWRMEARGWWLDIDGGLSWLAGFEVPARCCRRRSQATDLCPNVKRGARAGSGHIRLRRSGSGSILQVWI